MNKINHPKHYNNGTEIECITLVRPLSFNIGNAVKYLYRYQEKKEPITDLKKAIWYLQDAHDNFETVSEGLAYIWQKQADVQNFIDASNYLPANIRYAFFLLGSQAIDKLILVDCINSIKVEIEFMEKENA